MKVVPCVRTSTMDQHPINQSEALSEWTNQRGWEVVKIHKEQGSPWKAAHQNHFALLLDDARERRFDALLVQALDRPSSEGQVAILTVCTG